MSRIVPVALAALIALAAPAFAAGGSDGSSGGSSGSSGGSGAGGILGGIAVRDLDAAISFFTDLGLTVLGRDTVSGEWTDTAVGLDGNHAKIAEWRHLQALERTRTNRPDLLDP